MVKTFGYCLFALVYYLCIPFPMIKKRVFCITTHDEGDGSNVNIAVKVLKEQAQDFTFSYLTKSDTRSVKSLAGLHTLFTFFIIKPYELARAETVLMDNIFLPYAYLRRRKSQKVIQLWHGTGTIKKFGQDVNTGKLKELEKRANSNVTHLVVNSQDMKKLYSSAFGISESNIYPIGLPKTDELLKRIEMLEITGRNTDKETVYRHYKIPKDKKLILYAPTFRDNGGESPRILEFIKQLSEKLPEEYYIGLRLHPFIAEQVMEQQKELPLMKRVCQMSAEKDVNTLLMACDLLISDYSSIIFEYCLRAKPMLFYAYDYEQFSDKGRGFYYDYESYVPGPVAFHETEIIQRIISNSYDIDRIKEFKDNNYSYTDGKATARLVELILR